MNEYYSDDLEYLYDQLLLIDLLIIAEIEKFRQEKNSPHQSLSGLIISEEEIDLLLQNPRSKKEEPVNHEHLKYPKALTLLSQSIKDKLIRTKEKGVYLKMMELQEEFLLNDQEVFIILLCAAPQFNVKYSKFFGYLQNDVTKKNPTVDFTLNLLCSSFTEKAAARNYFDAEAPLIKSNIIEFINPMQDKNRSLLSREIALNKRITDYITGKQIIDENLIQIMKIITPAKELSKMFLPMDISDKLKNFCRYYQTGREQENFLIAFSGLNPVRKKEIAEAISSETGIPLCIVDMPALFNSHLSFDYGMDLILRESNLLPAALLFENCDFLFSEKEDIYYAQSLFINKIDKAGWLVFLSTEEPLDLHSRFQRLRFINFTIPAPEYGARKQLWEHYLKDSMLEENVNINEMAGKYNLSPDQIEAIISTARTHALWRNTDRPIVTQEDLTEACHLHSNRGLNKVAQRIKPKHSWEDIVLIPRVLEGLHGIVDMVANKHIVYHEWGFDNKLSLGKGVSALFSGEPGTGKTLACEIIAGALEMDLFKIDISTIISKYIGETEKNLNRIFTEAQNSNAILFFDEADAIFGKRTEVKDSHDRYANIEVSYLLQKIDEYTGVVILATNYSQNIDSAFERRLHFSITFPFPEEEQRLQIWKNIFPRKTPLTEDIDLISLAKHLRISGGIIKNIALGAAFLAAKERSPVSMSYVLQAAQKEYKKMGRLWDKHTFKDF